MKKFVFLLVMLVLAACTPTKGQQTGSTPSVSSKPSFVPVSPWVRPSGEDKGTLPSVSDQRTVEELSAYVPQAIAMARKEWKRQLAAPELPDWKVVLLTTPNQVIDMPCNVNGRTIPHNPAKGEDFPFRFCLQNNTFYVSIPLLRVLMLEAGYPARDQQRALVVALVSGGEVSQAYRQELAARGQELKKVANADFDQQFFFANCVAGSLAIGLEGSSPRWIVAGALDITGVYDRSETDGRKTYQEASVYYIWRGFSTGLAGCIAEFNN